MFLLFPFTFPYFIAYFISSGYSVVSYEQDWLNENALPANTLTDGDTFLRGRCWSMMGGAQYLCLVIDKRQIRY